MELLPFLPGGGVLQNQQQQNHQSQNQQHPTLFELHSADVMVALLKPALHYVLMVFAQRHPRYLLPLFNHVEEVYAAIMLATETSHLSSGDSSFSESFYSLKRVMVTGRGSTAPLDSRGRLLALIPLVLVPYVKAKLDKYHESLASPAALTGEEEEEEEEEEDDEFPTARPPPTAAASMSSPSSSSSSWKEVLRNLFRDSYPYVRAAYETALFAYQLLYVFERTKYYSPWLHLIGQQITRLTREDVRRFEERDAAKMAALKDRISGPTLLAGLRWRLFLTLARAVGALQYFLPFSIFAFRFLEWWYRHQQSKSKKAQWPIPPPPSPIPPSTEASAVALPETKDICALCRRPRTNPTMLPSGYVYCYPCIHQYVAEHHRCPISGDPAETHHLRKLYLAT